MTFKTVIGLEIHVQLKTQSKMFCGCDNNAENAPANTLTCPVCMGLPGVLPVANRQAIEWTIKTGLALNGKIADFSKFDRKHYFYPDLPKGYQISQYDLPFVVGGQVEIDVNGSKKSINLTRIHLEEDAGKLVHAGGDSLVDLNRAGTPLMEIVTEPEIDSPLEAKIFLQELRSILRYLDVSSADMEKGHLRCDANISIAEIRNPNDEIRLGTPVEIKNMNSFRMVERALLYEEKRQRQEIELGHKINKETRGWDDIKGETYSQRSKEQAQDYRYFPEPDLGPFEPKSLFDFDQIRESIPELPAAKRAKYTAQGLPLQDAEIIALDQDLAQYFEKVADKIQPKIAANWIINELKMDGLLVIEPDKLVHLLTILESGKISGHIAKEVLLEMIKTGRSAAAIIEDKGLAQIDNKEDLEAIVDKVIGDNPQVFAQVKKGKTQAVGFLVGQVMRETKGQANPQLVNEILQAKVNIDRTFKERITRFAPEDSHSKF